MGGARPYPLFPIPYSPPRVSRRSAFMLQCPAMRWKLLSLLLTLAALGTALALPADPLTRAQDGTPPPPVLVSDAPRPISRPPLGETFDTAAGWLPDGLWRFEASAGYDGAGWRVDGSRRGMTSTLEYGGLVDLSGKNSAPL